MDENNQLYESPEIQETQEQPDVEVAATESAAATQQAPPRESNAVRFLREEKNRLEREKIELANRLKQLEESQKSSVDPNDLVQRGYVDQQHQEMKREVQKITAEYKIKMQYPDFDKVVNDDTISALRDKYPSLAMTIGQTYDRDPLNGNAAAYEAIKNMGLYVDDAYAQDRDRAQMNSNKPKSLQAVAPAKQISPIAAASAFASDINSQEYKDKVYKEMMFFAGKR